MVWEMQKKLGIWVETASSKRARMLQRLKSGQLAVTDIYLMSKHSETAHWWLLVTSADSGRRHALPQFGAGASASHREDTVGVAARDL
jgi:hypothetical protein